MMEATRVHRMRKTSTETQEVFSFIKDCSRSTLRKVRPHKQVEGRGQRWEQHVPKPWFGGSGSAGASQIQRMQPWLTASLSLPPSCCPHPPPLLTERTTPEDGEVHFLLPLPRPHAMATSELLVRETYEVESSLWLPRRARKGRSVLCSMIPAAGAISIAGKFKAEIRWDIQPSSSHKWI